MAAIGRRLFFAGLGAAFLWAAACGGDDDDSAGGAGSPAGGSAGTVSSGGGGSSAATGGTTDTGGGGGSAGAGAPAGTGGPGGTGGGTAEDGGADDAGPSGDEAICTGCGACEETLTVESAAHMAGDIDYADPPPAGGPHNPCWADYGAYLGTPLPAENWVHNLEHGAVVFVYHCPDGCEGDVAALAGLVAASPRTIVTAYADMAPGFAAISWGHRLVSECLDIDAFSAFYEAHFDQAPESVPSGAPSGC